MVKRFTSDKVDVSRLGQPLHFEFSGRTAPNRFMKAAMTERLSSWSPTDLPARGVPSPELINVYKRWGEGGFGVVLTGNIMMAYDQLEASGNMIVPLDASPTPGDERFEAFQKLASAGKAQGALIIGQVSHPGRQTEDRLQPDPVSASDVKLEAELAGRRFAKPHAATPDEIAHIIRLFTHTAVYLARAGFDGIQLHGAHGYLLAQFLSQTTNKRTDQYGGSLENRARLIVEIARSIRRELPAATSKFVLGIKINSVEFQAEGFTPDEARDLCAILERNDFDFVELSGGTYEKLSFAHQRDSSVRREAFFLEFADSIVPGLTRTKTYVTGGFRTSAGMVRALDTVDGVGLGRPATQEFHLPRDILNRKVDAAIEPLIDGQDFGLTAAASGVQMVQVGRDEQPVDLSDPKDVDVVRRSLGEWMARLKEDEGTMSLYGAPVLPKGPAYVE